MPENLSLNGRALTPATLARAARTLPRLYLDVAALSGMEASHRLIEQAIRDKTPVYGVTTGLGARSAEMLDAETLSAFSAQTLRGRAHAVGPAEGRDITRAGLLVRLNTLLTGHSGARPALARHIAACLEAGLTPLVGQTGSIGVADLVTNATVGLALIGEGQMQDDTGQTGPSADMMAAHGIAPLTLAPCEGLALASHSGAVAGGAALALIDTQTAFEAAQTAAALSMEAFRANPGPLGDDVLAVKPHPGTLRAAQGMRHRLAGSRLFEPGAARRLQDPLSFRNIAQIHGTTATALDHAEACLKIEINSSSDNPVALVAQGQIASGGGYFTSDITSIVETLSRSLVPLAFAQLARIAKLLDPGFSGLPAFLARPDSGSNGFAPVMKTAEALMAEIAHGAQPVPIWPSLNANGVEDCLTHSPLAVRALARLLPALNTLTAIELMVAAQAIDLRGGAEDLGPALAATLPLIRAQSPELAGDRPLGAEIDALAGAVAQGVFSLVNS